MRAWQIASIGFVFIGCVVGEDGLVITDPDPQPDPTPSSTLVGDTLDYYSQTPLSMMSVETQGLLPERVTYSDETSRFEEVDIPAPGVFLVTVGASDAHLRTVNPEVRLDDVDIEVDVTLFAVAIADRDRQNATAGQTTTPEASLTLISLVDFAGEPVSGIPRADIILQNLDDESVRSDGYVVGDLGDIDPSLELSSIFGGESRVAFLNVIPGNYELTISCAGCTPAQQAYQSIVASELGGAIISRVVVDNLGDNSDPTFEDVFLTLGTSAQGGQGCANCHTAGGASALILDGDPNLVRETLTADGLINLEAPAASLLLQKPLYEVPADHPNATWIDSSSLAYQQIRRWIELGVP